MQRYASILNAVALAVFFFLAPARASETLIPPGEYVDVANLEVMEMITAGNSGLFLDVSKPEEWKEGHVREALSFPLEELEKRLGEIIHKKEEVVFVISKFGDRSRAASEILSKKGFKKVHNILGGMVDWKIMGYPFDK